LGESMAVTSWCHAYVGAAFLEWNFLSLVVGGRTQGGNEVVPRSSPFGYQMELGYTHRYQHTTSTSWRRPKSKVLRAIANRDMRNPHRLMRNRAREIRRSHRDMRGRRTEISVHKSHNPQAYAQVGSLARCEFGTSNLLEATAHANRDIRRCVGVKRDLANRLKRTEICARV